MTAAPLLIGPQPLPPPRLAITLPDGTMEPVWHRFFMSLFARTGSAPGADVLTIQTTANTTEALATDLDALLGLSPPEPLDLVAETYPDFEPPEVPSPDGVLWQSPTPEDLDPWAAALLAEPA